MATCRLNRLKTVILPLFILMVSGTPAIGSDRNEPIRPLPLTIDLNPDKVALGDLLFHDTRFSGNNTISCAHCHNLATGGTDHRATSSGINGQLGGIKAPTVFNSGFHFVQFWDGRAATLEEQIEGPVHNPLEMGSSWPNVIKKLQADPKLSRTFKKSYPDGITSANIKDAIATFERSLITFNSRFDQWLRGDEKALSEQELQGYLLFKDYGCISCHQGMNVGGNMYGYMGAMGDYFADRGTPLTQADMGRFNITGLEEDKHLFRVPCLRLAAINPPYFHDGSAKTLEEAVRIMGLYQLGREIPPKDVQAIVAFLHTLVGNHPRLHP
ncbi:Cytochrome c peroxidase [endosymbiont of Ridgeia piscesae]|jgi:cytochrome c peroxidase|uniref:Cytochrome c peroxidase n=2 Tax=endosymbiont of Ridgeia piscesae TaxID=54398 RepID=A0A0T5YUV2_9GAMM|nr:cytochrome-c peroxidase [endosymbiont of Ridgeia piscesae]KRT54349.1 Cytochrome c peroxidase [endosymbiont of Ridgeia piscesae]